MDRIFTASYDTTTKVVSGAVCVLLIGVPGAVVSPWFCLVSGAILLAAYAYSVRGFHLQDGAIVIKRLVGDVTIPISAITEIRRATPDDLRWTIRLMGSGGLFGYYGLFRTSALGKCTWYVTNRSNNVVVRTASKVMLLSPDEPDAFVAAVRPSIVQSPAMDVETTGGSSMTVGIVLGVAGGLAVLGAIAFVFSWAPGPPKYTLTADALTIHDKFYPVTLNKAEVDVASIRVIDFSVDKDWRPTMRTNGFANSHYRSGWFKVANGQKIRMYRAEGRSAVLIPARGDGTPVLLEVPQPEDFTQQLRREWQR